MARDQHIAGRVENGDRTRRIIMGHEDRVPLAVIAGLVLEIGQLRPPDQVRPRLPVYRNEIVEPIRGCQLVIVDDSDGLQTGIG